MNYIINLKNMNYLCQTFTPKQKKDSIDGIKVSIIASSVVDHVFKGQSKDKYLLLFHLAHSMKE